MAEVNVEQNLLSSQEKIEQMFAFFQQKIYTVTNGEWFDEKVLLPLFEDAQKLKDILRGLFDRNMALLEVNEAGMIYKITVDPQDRIMYLQEAKQVLLDQMKIYDNEIEALINGTTTTKSPLLV